MIEVTKVMHSLKQDEDPMAKRVMEILYKFDHVAVDNDESVVVYEFNEQGLKGIKTFCSRTAPALTSV
jgi:hypothetical protein